jgi:hypothetical protein
LLPHLSEHPHNWWEQCNCLWETISPMILCPREGHYCT